jgi:hypothetical protein
MSATTAVRDVDLSSSTGIEQYLRSREELATQVALLRLGAAAEAVTAWRALRPAPRVAPAESLLERFERVNGRPLVDSCPPRCSCRGAPVTVR